MKLVYCGIFDAVTVPDLGPQEVRKGEPVDVPDDLAERLLQQRESWRPAPAKKEG